MKLRTIRAALRPKAPSPLGALARGLVAGAAGAGIQSLFFKLTAKLTPKPTQLPPGVAKPRDEAGEKSALQTISRRFGEGLMRRTPPTPSFIHYAFGAAWGGLYGLARESFRISPLLFGAAVWMLSDNLLLPLFRVAAWPHRYSLAEHHYALQAHFAYGLGTAGAYALLRDFGAAPLACIPAIAALQARAWALRTPAGRLVQHAQPFTHRAVNQFLDKLATA